MTNDYSGRDRVALLSTGGALYRKPSVPPDLWGRYWRDVHGPLAARIAGIYQYWQYHLDAVVDDFWLAETVRSAVPSEDQFDGFAELTFRSEADRRALGNSPIAALLGQDEQNVFARTVEYQTAPGNARTYADAIENGAPQGGQQVLRLLAFFQQAYGASIEEFRRVLRDCVAPSFASSAEVLKLRLHLLEPYDPSLWDTPHVDHTRAVDQQYQAWMEIVFPDRDAANRFRSSSAVAGQLTICRAVHTYAVRATYTMVYGGRPTLAGLRSYPVAQTVMQLGAENQTGLEILRALYGDTVEQPLDATSGQQTPEDYR